jgi:DNA-binding transcriptional LysR family regulator
MTRNLDSLNAFLHVARVRSFRQAATRLGLSASALSHLVARLEADLGVRLLNRTTRSVSPTAAGERLLARLGPALDEVDAALDELNDQRTALRGKVRLNVPRAAVQLVLAPRLGAWRAAYPEVELEIVSSDAVVDIVEQGFDGGMRFGELLQQDMVAVPVGPQLRFAVCAAPAYLERHGTPHTPDELLAHQCIQVRFPSGARYRWEFRHGGQPLHIATSGALALDDMGSVVQAAADGAGICYTYEHYALPHFETGRLRPVLQAYTPPPEHIYLYYPSGRNMSASLRALIDFLKH